MVLNLHRKMSFHPEEFFVSDALFFKLLQSGDTLEKISYPETDFVSNASSDSKASSFNLLQFYDIISCEEICDELVNPMSLLQLRVIADEKYKIKRTREILIDGYPYKTNIEDLRIRFSVYGDIKECYFLPNYEKFEKAVIIFYETDSGVKAIKHGQRGKIYLHNKKLTVCANLENIKELQNYLENHRGNTSINELNDDCLLEIFEYLAISERLKLRSICTRWRSLSNESFRTIRHFDLGIYRNDIINFKNIDYKKQFQKYVEEIRCKTSLICEIELFIGYLHMQHVVTNCTNLTKLIVKCPIHDERILSHIFRMNQELRHVEINCPRNITGESLIYLPEKLHTLIVKECYVLSSNNLCAALKRLKNLKCLKVINQFKYIVSNIFNEYCQNLETLHLDFFRPEHHITSPDTFSITNLKNLRYLRILGYQNLSWEFLVKLSENCRELRCLKLKQEEVWYYDERKIDAITSLAKLQILSLETYGCGHPMERYDRDKTDKLAIRLLHNLPELRKLTLITSSYIGECIFSETKMVNASRSNNVMLEFNSIQKDKDGTYKKKISLIYNGKIY